MPYQYTGVHRLDGGPFVGSGTCVDLIKKLVPGLIGVPTSAWKAGDNVMEAFKAGKTIAPGTAIATFENGRYPQQCQTGYIGSCHHAALVLSVQNGGMWVMDQYTGDPKRQHVGRRFIHIPPPSCPTVPSGTPATIHSPFM